MGTHQDFHGDGRSYADVEIPYLAKRTSIEDIRGRTVRTDGTVIPFNGAVFDKLVVKYKSFRDEAKAFTLPGVEVGSIIEYAYAVRWKERLPDYVRNPAQFGHVFEDGWTIPTTTWTVQQELFTRHAVFVIRPVKGGHLDFAKVRLPDNWPSQQPDRTMRMEANNVPAIEQEEHMPPESLLNSRVHFYYTVGDVGNFWHSFSKVRADLAEKFTQKTHFLERAANDIAPLGDPPETRLRKLYARVQKFAISAMNPQRPRRRSSASILRRIKARKISTVTATPMRTKSTFCLRRWLAPPVSTRQSWRLSTESPRTSNEVLDGSQLDAMVVMVRLKDGLFYFDPASRFCPYGIVPWFESDTKGVRWDKVGGDVIEVATPANDSSAIERTAELKLQPDGGLEGTLEVMFTGQEALDWRLLASDEDEAGRRKLVEDEIKELTPTGATIGLESFNRVAGPRPALANPMPFACSPLRRFYARAKLFRLLCSR